MFVNVNGITTGCNNIFQKLLGTGCLVIQVTKHVISIRKQHYNWVVKQIRELHHAVELELHTFDVIWLRVRKANSGSDLRSSSRDYFVAQSCKQLKTECSFYHREVRVSSFLIQKGVR